MSDNICDSWEDVDVDNIVIKTNDKKKSYAFVANNSLPSLSSQSNNSNNNFDIVENGESIVVNNNELSNDISSGGGAFRILPRANNISASNQVTTSVPASSILGMLSGSERPSIILDDNSARSQFVNKLRILNRPSKADPNAGDKDRSSVDVNQLLMRSFEEKKAEYSKARLRILGEEMPAEKLVLDEVGDSMEQLSLNRSPTTKSAKSVSSTNSNSSSSLLNNNRKATTQLSSITSSSLLTTANLISNTIATAATTNHLIRQPIVPDGTKGFGNRTNQNPNNNKSSANFSSPSTHRK